MLIEDYNESVLDLYGRDQAQTIGVCISLATGLKIKTTRGYFESQMHEINKGCPPDKKLIIDPKTQYIMTIEKLRHVHNFDNKKHDDFMKDMATLILKGFNDKKSTGAISDSLHHLISKSQYNDFGITKEDCKNLVVEAGKLYTNESVGIPDKIIESVKQWWSQDGYGTQKIANLVNPDLVKNLQTNLHSTQSTTQRQKGPQTAGRRTRT